MPINPADDIERRFNSFFANVGGFIDPSKLPDSSQFKKIICLWNERANNLCNSKTEQLLQQENPFSFGFIANGDVQACAGGIFNMVAVYIGVPLTLIQTFAWMLSIPKNFPEIGDANKEDSETPKFSLPKQGVNLYDNQLIVPNCLVRLNFSALLARFAFDFLLGHEFGHLERGHNFIDQAGYANSMIQEKGNIFGGNHVKQALEIDADLHGIMHTFEVAINLMKQLESGWYPGGPNALEASSKFNTIENCIYYVIFSVTVLFKILEDDYTETINLDLLSHPPSVFRMSMLINNAMTTVKKRYKLEVSDEQISKIFIDAKIAAEFAILEMTGAKGIYILDPKDPIVIHHLNILTNTIKKIEPDLQKAQLFPFEHHY